jgi:hypothetical protein
MRPRAVCLAFVAGLAFWASAGAAGSPAGTLPPGLLAEQLMSAVVGSQRWAEFIYGIHPPAPPTCTAGFEGEPVENPDGSFTSTFITANCTRIIITQFFDGSSTQEITYTDGSTESVTATAGDFLFPPDGLPSSYAIAHRFSSGNRADYTRQLDIVLGEDSIDVLAEHYRGTFNLGKRTVRFSFDRVTDPFNPAPDVLAADFPGGAHLLLSVPLDPFEFRPDYTSPAIGEISLKGRTLPFALVSDAPAAAEPRWTRLAVGNPDGTPRSPAGPHGQFALGPDFSGRGTLFQGRRVAFLATWNRRGRARLVLGNGQATSAGPAGGLLEFALLRWSGLASKGGPDPGL